jgi:hypothetical protein
VNLLKEMSMLASQTTAETENDINLVRLGLELPAVAASAAASAFEDIKQKFTNHKQKFTNQRQWREFVSAVQCSVNYPAAINSLRSGTKWFSDGLAQASSCLARTLHVAQIR